MTWTGADFVQDDRQLFGRTLGETLAKMVRQRWPHSTAKNVARAWGLDPTTAENLIRGHASERTITKALRAEGWELLSALGHALTGQTHHEWEEQRLRRSSRRPSGRMKAFGQFVHGANSFRRAPLLWSQIALGRLMTKIGLGLADAGQRMSGGALVRIERRRAKK
jgi:hypothetical protein